MSIRVRWHHPWSPQARVLLSTRREWLAEYYRMNGVSPPAAPPAAVIRFPKPHREELRGDPVAPCA